MGSSSQGLTRLKHRSEWRCRVASSTSRTSMVVLIKRRIQWRMTNDFSQLSRIGKRSSCNGLIYSYPNNLEGIGKKSKVCGRPNLKGNMLAVRRPHNPLERTRITGLEFSGEVRNHKKLVHSRRSLRPLLNVIRFVESSSRVHCPDGYNGACIGPLQFSEQYHTDIENHKNSFARSCTRDYELAEDFSRVQTPWSWKLGDLEHAENTVGAYWSKYRKDALVKIDWETLDMTRNGGPRWPARENHWGKVLRRIQQCDPCAYNDIIKSLASHSRRVLVPSAYSKSEVVRTLKVSEKKRGFPMPARKSKPCISPTTMRGTKMPTSLRKSKVRKSSKGRLHRAGGAPQTPSWIGARSSLTSSNAASLKHLSPLLLRRSQIRFRWHLSEGRRSDRVLPASVLHLGYRKAPWLAKREKAAIVLQAQWRMCLARSSYQSLQRATLTIQRQWRETKEISSHTNSTLDVAENETSVVDFMKPNICRETNGPDDLAAEQSAAATRCKEFPGKDSQRSLKMPGLSIERLYDTYISAIQEDEIFDEFLSFLPCPELSSENVLSTPTRTGSDRLLQSHSLLLEERPLLTPHSPDSPKSSSAVLAEDDGIILQSPPSPKTWNYDICYLDSPACSPAKELTFARISIDGSLPPTPIKEWSSRKRDPVKRTPAVPVVWDPSSTLDMVELHHSPTKDWASPLTRGGMPSLILVGSPDAELKRELFQLPSEWFMDLDELDIPESCWDTSKVTSISFSPPSDPHLNSLHVVSRVPCTDSETIVPSSGALICIPEESAHNVSPTHENIKNCALIANSAVIEKSPISDKLTADSSPKTVDLSRRRDTAFSDKGVDGFSLSPSANVPTKATDSRLGSPLSPALEEELLDELAKLFQGSPDPAVGLSDISSSPAGPPSSANDFRCSDSLRSSHPKALSRVCSGTLGKDGFSGNSARKLNFNFGDEDGLKDSEDNQEVCNHDGELQMPVENMGRMVVEHGKSLSPLSMLPSLTLSEPAMYTSQGSDEILDGNGQKHLGMYEELDDATASRDSQSYSKRCQSTVTNFLQLVEQNLATGAGGSDSSPGRSIDRLPCRSLSMPQSPEPQLPTFEDEDDFCDKAVDGNIVAVKDTLYQDRDLLPDPFHASIGWEAASATEFPNGTSGPPVECAAVDIYDTSFSSKVSTFVTPNIQRSNTAITRSCGAIIKTKPPLPMKSRRISFDQINYKSNEPFTPADEKRPLLPDMKVSARLLHTSPVSPDTPLPLYTAPLGYQERSSALSVSKKYFLQSPSSKIQFGKCDSDTESVVSPASSHSTMMESSLEGVEKKACAKHARALFTCQESALPKTSEDGILKSASLPSWNDVSHFSCFEDNYEAMLRHRDTHRLWGPDNLSGPLLLTSGAESDCSFRKSTSSAWDCGLMTLMTDGGFSNVENSSPSLHDLCKVWEEESMDLVTRSLKYKSLMTDPDLLRQELKVAFEKTEPSSPQTVAWEIQNIERLKEKLESRERLKELIRQQRDTIYINIATNASMRERYRLYSKWGIRRMSRARLRKVIYELLWKDSKRFHASADLVLQYL